jgi:serine/threonine-protein kinase
MTRTGAVMGTPYYMSPEQAKGARAIDARSDLYSVGVIIYEAITGQVPFNAETFNELIFKIALESPPPPEQFVPNLDPAFGVLMRKAMAREPAERYQTALELKEAMLAWARDFDARGGVPAPQPRAGTQMLPMVGAMQQHRGSYPSAPVLHGAPMQTGQAAAHASQPAIPATVFGPAHGGFGPGQTQLAHAGAPMQGAHGESPRRSQMPVILALSAGILAVIGGIVFLYGRSGEAQAGQSGEATATASSETATRAPETTSTAERTEPAGTSAPTTSETSEPAASVASSGAPTSAPTTPATTPTAIGVRPTNRPTATSPVTATAKPTATTTAQPTTTKAGGRDIRPDL